MANVYGYSKIQQVIIQKDYDSGLQPFDIVWIEADGDLFEVSVMRNETEEELQAKYEKQGWTDDRCIFVQKL